MTNPSIPFPEWMKSRPNQHQKVVKLFLDLMHPDEIFHLDKFANNSMANRLLSRGDFAHLKPSSRITYVSRFVSSIKSYYGLRRASPAPVSRPVQTSSSSSSLSIEEQFQEAWMLMSRCPDLRVHLALHIVAAQKVLM